MLQIYGLKSLHDILEYRYVINKDSDIAHLIHGLYASQDRKLIKLGKEVSINEDSVYGDVQSTVCGFWNLTHPYYASVALPPDYRLCKNCVKQLPKKRLERK